MWESGLSIAVFAIGGLGVPLGGVYMTWKMAGKDGLKDLWKRIYDPKRISGRWWFAIIMFYPLIKLIGWLLAWQLNITSQPLEFQQILNLITDPLNLLYSSIFILLLGPLPEEVGWRGYLLDRLQLRFNPLGASIIVGLLWFAWHLPLFFMPGYYERVGGSPDPLQFGVLIILGSILYTWIYNNTDRSILGAIVLHFAGNFTGEKLDAPAAVYNYELYLTIIVVLFILWRGFSKQSENQETKTIKQS